MSKKAAAFKEYREAAMVDMLLQTLPKVGVPISVPCHPRCVPRETITWFPFFLGSIEPDRLRLIPPGT